MHNKPVLSVYDQLKKNLYKEHRNYKNNKPRT